MPGCYLTLERTENKCKHPCTNSIFVPSKFFHLYLLSFPFCNLKKQAIKTDSLLTNIYSIISKDFRILHSSFPIATGSVRLYSLGINNENTLSM